MKSEPALNHRTYGQNLKVIYLKANMRVHLHNDVDSGHYAEMLLKIDDGRLGTDAEGYTLISRQFCILVENNVDLIVQVYPELKQNLNSDQWLCTRAILAPRHDS